MEQDDVRQVLADLRRLGGEPSGVEVKAARGGLPRTIVETASAFANTNGGLVLLGVDEADDFGTVVLPDPAKLRDDLVSALSDQLEPPVRPATDLVEIDDRIVVSAEIAPLTSDQKPCYVRSRGIANGSYVRAGDGDRRMTQAEIGLTIANRGQPTYDAEPVLGAGVDDLDIHAVRRMLERARSTSRSLRDVDDESALRRLRVLVTGADGHPVPSLGGLLALGSFPQEHFPQLMITLVVHGTDPSSTGQPRFLDNQQFRGPIPEQVAECLAAVRRNIAVRGFVGESGRLDALDYPLEAVREALVNAVLHRDYSPVSRGTQVMIDIHPDRLEVASPGGLFGPVTVAELGEEGVSSSRNGYLAQLLSDTYLPHSDRVVAENRASGIPAMIHSLIGSGLPQPVFRNHPGRFEVRFERSELFDPRTREWLDEVRRPGFSHLHDLALALLAHGQEIDNARLRVFGADRATATGILTDLVSSGLATRSGGRRYARYQLSGPESRSVDTEFPGPSADGGSGTTYDAVTTVLRRRGRATAAEIASEVGRSRPAVLGSVRTLIDEGRVRAEGSPTSPRRSYVWCQPVHAAGGEAT